MPQPLPSLDGDNFLGAVDRARVQLRTGHLHLQPGFEVLGRAGDKADGLAGEETRDLMREMRQNEWGVGIADRTYKVAWQRELQCICLSCFIPV